MMCLLIKIKQESLGIIERNYGENRQKNLSQSAQNDVFAAYKSNFGFIWV